jgi:hypothetical protein
MANAGEVIKEIVEDAPLVFKALEAAVELIRTWSAGDAEAKAACEAQAGAMLDARHQTKASHEERLAHLDSEIQAGFDAQKDSRPEAPKLDEFDTSDVKK